MEAAFAHQDHRENLRGRRERPRSRSNSAIVSQSRDRHQEVQPKEEVKMISKTEIAEMAEEAGVTPDAMKKVIESLENYRAERGEEANRELVHAAKEITKWAKDDGLSIAEMVNAILRRKS
jgi:hypothetical protein